MSKPAKPNEQINMDEWLCEECGAYFYVAETAWRRPAYCPVCGRHYGADLIRCLTVEVVKQVVQR